MPRSATEVGGQTNAPAPTVRSGRALGVLLVVGGLIGLVAAVVLLVEKIALIENPNYIPTCTINPVLSCGSVMTTPQADAFGIPNPIIGIAGFAVLAAVGAGLLAGARYASWLWIAIQGGVSFAVVFVHWLIYQSLYVIGALCPYCMVVWAVTIPLFWYVTVSNLQALDRGRRFILLLGEYRGAVLTGWFILLVTLIAIRFWNYWSTLV